MERSGTATAVLIAAYFPFRVYHGAADLTITHIFQMQD
jgi:hypothetical protein